MPEQYAPSVPPDWGRIPVEDGVELAYTEKGSGPPVVLVPGWTMSGEVFEHQFEDLARTYRVITLDPRSHGRSTATAGSNTYVRQGRDLVAFVEKLGLDGIHLVGWSYGALACYEAIDLAGSHGIRSLTVVDQTPRPLATGADGEWAEMDIDGFLDDFLTPVLAEPNTFATEFITWITDRTLTRSERRWLEAMHMSTARHAAASLLVSAMLSDYRDVARALDSTLPSANVLSRDSLDEARPWLSANLPHSVVWEIPSHLGFWERHADFDARFVSFLESGR
jgi:non-heme chloroperoxidase